MARNKITFEQTYDDTCRRQYIFTGSQRQPTLVEARNFIVENGLYNEIYDYFGIAHVKLRGAEEWMPPEDCKTLVLYGYEGGSGDGGSCPVCGHERDMSGTVCPVCLKPWED